MDDEVFPNYHFTILVDFELEKADEKLGHKLERLGYNPLRTRGTRKWIRYIKRTETLYNPLTDEELEETMEEVYGDLMPLLSAIKKQEGWITVEGIIREDGDRSVALTANPKTIKMLADLGAMLSYDRYLFLDDDGDCDD